MSMVGVLYVIATPIGNLDDVTGRGAKLLRATQTIACEDTRRTRVLLEHLGANPARLIACHEHSEGRLTAELLARLQGGEDVALVSDAGTPLISDPGHELVRAARAAELPVVPVPGPSAVMAALSVCPLPVGRFAFLGFLPAKDKARREQLRSALRQPDAVVLFEAPHRILATLETIDALAAGRELFVARELTKRYESFYSGTARQVVAALQQDDACRGEFVVVLDGDHGPPGLAAEHEMLLRLLCDELPPARAARLAARITGLDKQALYRLALALAGR